jgi:hypothetical protein
LATHTPDEEDQVTNSTKPFVQLSGEDGNAMFIISRCRVAAKAAGWDKERIDAFTNEAMSGNYDHVLQTVMAQFKTA